MDICHIVLAMKPVEGNFVENAIKHGVSGINITETRIAGPAWKWGTQTDLRGGGFGSRKPSDGSIMAKGVDSNPAGRWPANAILGHSEGCVRKGVKKVKGEGHWTNKREVGKNGIYGKFRATDVDNGNPGKEAIEDWECVEGCAVRVIGEQSGELKSGGNAVRKKEGVFKAGNVTHGGLGKIGDKQVEHSDKVGTAARFFKQVSEFREDTI